MQNLLTKDIFRISIASLLTWWIAFPIFPLRSMKAQT